MQERSFEEEEFVPVVYARTMAEAEHYRTMLEDHDIRVLIEDEDSELVPPDQRRPGIPVLVPAEQLADAEDILEELSCLEDQLRGQFGGAEEEEVEELDEVEEFQVEQAGGELYESVGDEDELGFGDDEADDEEDLY